jgi:hypothetical protein
MFRFAVLILAGIGLGALIFGSDGASAGLWFLLAIPVFVLLKIAFFGAMYGAYARSRDHEWRRRGAGPPWSWDRPSRRRSEGSMEEARPSEADRFEAWHRMAHAREEVDGWAAEPE